MAWCCPLLKWIHSATAAWMPCDVAVRWRRVAKPTAASRWNPDWAPSTPTRRSKRVLDRTVKPDQKSFTPGKRYRSPRVYALAHPFARAKVRTYGYSLVRTLEYGQNSPETTARCVARSRRFDVRLTCPGKERSVRGVSRRLGVCGSASCWSPVLIRKVAR